MKNKYLFILLALGLISCEGELVDYEEKEIKFPFEALNLTNFNNASSVLAIPPTNVRLDSVVYLRYYRFNPELGTSDYQWRPSNKSQAFAPPPPEPTSRSSEHFNYNENNQLTSIQSYSNYDHEYEYTDIDLSIRGELQYVKLFEYDNQNNLIRSGYQAANDSETIINPIEFVYNSSNVLNESIRNGWIKKIKRNNNLIEVEEFSEENISKIKSVYFLDSFNNISKFIYGQGTQYEFENAFNYPKNIYHPYVNLFAKNFYPFLIFDDYQGGFSHLTSGPTVNYYQQIQVNNQGFPEIAQSGSYDNGYRTFYYYSIY